MEDKKNDNLVKILIAAIATGLVALVGVGAYIAAKSRNIIKRSRN